MPLPFSSSFKKKNVIILFLFLYVAEINNIHGIVSMGNQKRRLWGDLPTAFQYLMEMYKGAGE